MAEISKDSKLVPKIVLKHFEKQKIIVKFVI